MKTQQIATRQPVTGQASGNYVAFLQPPLMTWNAFFSASAYERNEPGGWAAVEDLVSVVDALCFQEEISVLGDPRHRPFAAHDSSFFDAIRRSKVLTVDSLNDSLRARAAELARKHAVLFFGPRNLRRLESWISEAFTLNEFRSAVSRPTMNLDVRTRTPNEIRLLTVSALANRVAAPHDWNARTFTSRTFMYYACAEMLQREFLPDAARKGIIQSVTKEERRWSVRVGNAATAAWREFPETGRMFRQRLSPFTAELLERCDGDAHRLAPELLALREELRPVREKLRSLEFRRIHQHAAKSPPFGEATRGHYP